MKYLITYTKSSLYTPVVCNIYVVVHRLFEMYLRNI
jgi:hypothetical protein